MLESTGHALAIARILQPHVEEVVLANPMHVRAISHAKVKNDRFDARTLAELLAADLDPRVWIGDEQTRLLRRLTSRRTQLIRQRTRTKNEISAVLVRNLQGRPPMSDPFGKQGRAWLAGLQLPVDEDQTVQGCLRQLDFLGGEIELIDRGLAEQALGSQEICRLMTIPGVGVTTAATVMAMIGNVQRFATAHRLVGYLGLDPRSRQSGSAPARHGRISKQGSSAARHVLVEAAWAAIKTPGPLRAFYQRIQARRGSQIAIVAVARKIAILCWQLLTNQQDYAYQRPAHVARKLRALELRAGADGQKGKPLPNLAACDPMLGLSRVAGMGIRDRVVERTMRLGTGAAEAATDRAERVRSGFQALRTVFADEAQPTNVETFLLTLIKAVRDDEPSAERTRRDVCEDARSRRRHLGTVSFGAGPLVGVATQIVDLYCDIATFCDLVDASAVVSSSTHEERGRWTRTSRLRPTPMGC